MKIEAITLHNIKNYGSALQTYATQKTIQDLGHDIEFIDYYRNDIIEENLLNNWIKKSSFFSKNIFTKIAGKLFLSKSIKQQCKVFNKFLNNRINLTDKKYYSNEQIKENLPIADIYCTGSDQVWNGEWNEGIERPYFLEFLPNDAKRIAYAASFGRRELNEQEKEEIEPMLKKYKRISVREQSGVKILENMGIRNVKHVLDPTLLLNKEDWSELFVSIKEKRKYILVYQLNTKNPKFDSYVKAVSKAKNIPVIRISNVCYQAVKYGKFVFCPDIEEFLSYFANAEYVITDSFHGTAFSINLNKKFVSIFPNKFSERLMSILKLTGLEDRQVKDFNDYTILDNEIDYTRINEILEKNRIESKKYLVEAIESCKSE